MASSAPLSENLPDERHRKFGTIRKERGVVRCPMRLE